MFLSDGQMRVNRPIKPRFVRAIAIDLDEERGSFISGISYNFLTNFEGCDLFEGLSEEISA